MRNVIENSFWIFFFCDLRPFELRSMIFEDVPAYTWKPFLFLTFLSYAKRKFVCFVWLLTNGAFFSTLLEFCWSHFRDRQISLVETGAFPDFRKKICRLVTQFERFQRNRLGPPIAEKLFKRKTKQNKQSCFCPCKRIGRNWSKVNDRYIR